MLYDIYLARTKYDSKHFKLKRANKIVVLIITLNIK